MAHKATEERQQAGVEGDWICVGALAGPRGVKGDVRLKTFTEDPKTIFTFDAVTKGPAGPLVTLTKVGSTKDGFIVRLDGVQTPEQAQALKGTRLYVPRESFNTAKDDEFYLADLIGLIAVDEAGAKLGFVKAVENYGAEDLLELVLDEPVKGLGRYIFVPFRKALVPDVDVAGERITIAFEEWHKTQVSERDEEAGK